MTSYHNQLVALHDAMVKQERTPLLCLIKPARQDALPRETRVAVYADGYVERLVEAVLADYPALAHYMGEDHTRSAIAAFVTATPSRFWDLNRYPPAFASFLEQFSNDKAAHALAKLESTIAEIFWATETPPLNPATLATLSEEEFGETYFHLRPTTCLLRLEYTANAYLTQLRADGCPPLMQHSTEHLLILRHNNEVKRLKLEAQEHTLLSALASGITFNNALAQVKDQSSLAEKLPAYLAYWMQHELFASLTK